MTICQRKEEEERDRENEKAPEKEGEKNIYFIKKVGFLSSKKQEQASKCIRPKTS